MKIQKKMSDDFVTWIPNIIKSSIVTVQTNSTALEAVFQRIWAQFARLYKRKAFLHWCKGEGMDEMEFQQADKICLIW